MSRDLEQELFRLRREVEEAHRAKDEYMQNVAHQLAAPINAIRMNIEAIKMPRVEFGRKQVLLRSVYAQGTILAHLIKNFSLMSHLDADHKLTGFREAPEFVDPFLLCVNYSNDFQPIGQYRDQKIIVDEASYKRTGSRKIYAIKNLFAQVVYNLLENATKYGESDSTIKIYFRSTKDLAMICVESYGVSIPADKTEAIFGRGVRGDGAKKANPAGTGFGLYIGRRIMEIHNGNLNVEVDRSKSTFIISCPTKDSK
jgi:signal transduction histidine kinase